MSIYIQIATIEDYGIINTVFSAIEGASRPDDIVIGIAATVSDEFYDNVIAPLATMSNVRAERYDPATGRGLGKGRIHSRKFYDDQDYILQVDAHTLFEQGWDDFLASLHRDAIAETENNKTLVTGYLGKHTENDTGYVVIDPWPGYSIWSNNNVTDFVPLKWASVIKVQDFPDWVVPDKAARFFPSNRVAGNFILGNREWACLHGWSGEEVFWEEEILPAITLLSNGFSLVFPNCEMPITHRYWGDDLTRQVMDDIFEDPTEIDILAIQHIERFVRENESDCNRYRDYAGYDLATNTITYKVYVPSKYGF